MALIDAQGEDEGQALLSPLHYLRQALAPTADLMEGGLSDMLLASPDALILADVATISPDEEEALIDWVERGGLLLRFAGPRLAASDVARDTAGPLMPVRLRAGGRSVGGAMSWGEPKALSPFPETSPFFGLDIPGDVTVESQVMAQPDPQLSERTIASLTDGTPLVTRAPLGQGSVVLFHVTANADWSSLPLSGLFVQMLERLAVSTRPAIPDAEDVAGITWVPEQVMDGFGTLRDAGIRPGIPGETMVEAPLSADLLPGLYTGGEQRIARNVVTPETELAPASWPASLPVEGMDVVPATDLMAAFLAAALGLLLIDALAALWLAGRLSGPISRGAAGLVVALILMGQMPSGAIAQTGRSGDGLTPEDELALLATSEVTLAYVITGDPELDRVSQAGMQGLTNTLWSRTSVEPATPIGVNLETDELAFFPDALLARLGRAGNAVGGGLPSPQRLPAVGRHDRVRHARRPYRRLRVGHARGAAPAHAGSPARHSAAGADPAGPCPDANLLPVAGFPRPPRQPRRLGRGRAAGCRADRGHALPQPQRRGDAGAGRRQ